MNPCHIPSIFEPLPSAARRVGSNVFRGCLFLLRSHRQVVRPAIQSVDVILGATNPSCRPTFPTPVGCVVRAVRRWPDAIRCWPRGCITFFAPHPAAPILPWKIARRLTHNAVKAAWRSRLRRPPSVQSVDSSAALQKRSRFEADAKPFLSSARVDAIEVARESSPGSRPCPDPA